VFVAIAIAFPVVLLLAVLGMERVEHRLGRQPATAAAHLPSAAHAASHPHAHPTGPTAAGASHAPSEPERSA
jgi:hypothetical protein